MSGRFRPGDRRTRQVPIPEPQPESGVYGPANTLVPWGAIATLQPRAETLSARVGLRFADSFDDVDALKVALIQTPSASLVALVDHLEAPVPATEVHANVADSGTAERVLHQVLVALNLTDKEVSWRRQWSR